MRLHGHELFMLLMLCHFRVQVPVAPARVVGSATTLNVAPLTNTALAASAIAPVAVVRLGTTQGLTSE